MEKTTLTQLFSQLSPSDLRELKKFVRSPFHNTRADVVRLFDFLAEKGAGDGSSDYRKLQFEAAYPAENYDEKRLRYLHGYFREVVFAFLTQQELVADAQKNRVHLVRALRRRGAGPLFEREWSASLTEMDRSEHRHISFFKRKSQLYLEFTEQAKSQRRGDAMFFQEMTDALTVHTLADLLRHGSTLLSHATVSGKNYDFPLLYAVLATIERQPGLLAEPIVAAYFHIYQLQTVDGGRQTVDDGRQTTDGERLMAKGQHFEELTRLLAENWQRFPASDSRDLYLFAINFCIKRMNSGEKPFVARAFELYRFGLENRLLLENGHLSPYAYNNILLIALTLGERVWALDFLEKWKPLLPEKERENTFLHNQSLFFYRTGDYENAMSVLQKVEFREPLRFLESRRMLLRIYHELGHFDALASLLDSLRIYLYRKNGLGYHRGSYLNLIKIMKKMLASDGSDRAVLLKEAREIPALTEREWVISILEKK